MSEPALPPARHETRDARFPYLAIGGALLIAAVLLFASVAYLIFPDSPLDRRYAGPVPDYARPRLQPSPRADMHAFFEEEMRRLYGVGWVDKQKGIVHIPIDQAMRLIAQQGIPDWPSPQPAGGAPPAQNAPLTQEAPGTASPPLAAPFSNPPAPIPGPVSAPAQSASTEPALPLAAPFGLPLVPIVGPAPAQDASSEATPPAPVTPPFANPPAPVPGAAPASESKGATP